MIKIPRVFEPERGGLATDDPNPGCEWVLAGEGYATVKIDGSSCMIDEQGRFWKRLLLRKKMKDAPPVGWVPCQERPEHGDWRGWILVSDTSDDQWHREAFAALEDKKPGTYELVGPQIVGNNEMQKKHTLVPHGKIVIENCPRTRPELIEFLRDRDIEGIVFYHPDGRMAKLRKKKDLGLPRRGGTPKGGNIPISLDSNTDLEPNPVIWKPTDPVETGPSRLDKVRELIKDLIRSREDSEAEELENRLKETVGNQDEIFLALITDPEELINVRAIATRYFVGAANRNKPTYSLIRALLSQHGSALIRCGVIRGLQDAKEIENIRPFLNDQTPGVVAVAKEALEEIEEER
jgi:hypothetical protein